MRLLEFPDKNINDACIFLFFCRLRRLYRKTYQGACMWDFWYSEKKMLHSQWQNIFLPKCLLSEHPCLSNNEDMHSNTTQINLFYDWNVDMVGIILVKILKLSFVLFFTMCRRKLWQYIQYEIKCFINSVE